MSSGGIDFSSIDFRKSSSSPLQFALYVLVFVIICATYRLLPPAQRSYTDAVIPSRLQRTLLKQISPRCRTSSIPTSPSKLESAYVPPPPLPYLSSSPLSFCFSSHTYRVHRILDPFKQSIGDSSLLNVLKVPKFFLQLQITRVNTANGVAPATAADTTGHQLAKVIKVRPLI